MKLLRRVIELLVDIITDMTPAVFSFMQSDEIIQSYISIKNNEPHACNVPKELCNLPLGTL